MFIEEPEPFIKNYKFIKGFTEGKLSYGSIEKNNETKANLKIFDFKVQDVPVLAKLLTLASLQGIADILTGCLLYTSPSPRDQRGSRMPSCG